jgi:hypothetical protein
MVNCDLCSNVSSCSDATWQISTFCKVTSITEKIVIKTRTKPNIKHKNFFKRKKTSVPQKHQAKKMFHKKISKQKKNVPQKN